MILLGKTALIKCRFRERISVFFYVLRSLHQDEKGKGFGKKEKDQANDPIAYILIDARDDHGTAQKNARDREDGIGMREGKAHFLGTGYFCLNAQGVQASEQPAADRPQEKGKIAHRRMAYSISGVRRGMTHTNPKGSSKGLLNWCNSLGEMKATSYGLTSVMVSAIWMVPLP